MKILTIPLLAHDASICILEDGEITSYQMKDYKPDVDIIEKLDKEFIEYD
jgi:hypothetical protein